MDPTPPPRPADPTPPPRRADARRPEPNARPSARAPVGAPWRRRTFLRVGGPDDLVAAVPYLVGFVPVRSVVVVSLRGPRLRCGLVARMDLPAAEHVRPWAEALASFVLNDNPRQVVVLVYHDRPWSVRRRPLGPAVDELQRRFTASGVPVKDALYVTSERFWSYLCDDPRCCPPEGRLLEDGRSSEIAASYVAEGKAPLADRNAVVGQLSPGPEEVLTATRRAAERALDLALSSGDGPDPDGHWQMWQIGTAELFSALVRRRLDGDTSDAGPDVIGRVVAGLLDRTTRDLVGLRTTNWLWAMPGRADPSADDPLAELPDDPATNLSDLQRLVRGCAAEDPRCRTPQGQREVAAVLAALCRASDGDLAVAPLVLAGMQAWASGEGVLAGAAVERALALDPECTMGRLLGQLLERCIAPAWVEHDRAEDEAAPPRAAG